MLKQLTILNKACIIVESLNIIERCLFKCAYLGREEAFI